MGFKEELGKAISVGKFMGRSHASTKSSVRMMLRSRNDEGMVSMVTGFAAVAIVVAVIVYILAQISSSMPAVANTSAYYGVQTTVDTTTVAGLGLLVIVLLIIAAAILMRGVGLIGGNR